MPSLRGIGLSKVQQSDVEGGFKAYWVQERDRPYNELATQEASGRNKRYLRSCEPKMTDPWPSLSPILTRWSNPWSKTEPEPSSPSWLPVLSAKTYIMIYYPWLTDCWSIVSLSSSDKYRNEHTCYPMVLETNIKWVPFSYVGNSPGHQLCS